MSDIFLGAYALIAPKGKILLDRIFENENDAWKCAGERLVGYSLWSDMTVEKRKVIFQALKLEGWTVVPVTISSDE